MKFNMFICKNYADPPPTIFSRNIANHATLMQPNSKDVRDMGSLIKTKPPQSVQLTLGTRTFQLAVFCHAPPDPGTVRRQKRKHEK